MTFQFAPEEPIDEGTRRIAREEIDGAIEALSWDDRDAAVHSIRKRFKKLRALLRLTHDPDDRTILRARIVAIRDAARTLADLRDSRVLLDTVEALARENPPLESTREVLATRYRETRIRHLDDANALAKLEEPLLAFREDVDDWQISARTFADIAPRLERTHRKGRRAHRVAGGVPTQENLHQWRKRVKDLWYHASLVLGTPGPEGPVDPGGVLVADLDALGGHLGLDHDYALLRQLATEGALPTLDPANGATTLLCGLIDQRRADLQALSWPLGERIYDAKPTAFVARMDQLRSGRRGRLGSAAD